VQVRSRVLDTDIQTLRTVYQKECCESLVSAARRILCCVGEHQTAVGDVALQQPCLRQYSRAASFFGLCIL
jgi:hypothetical protein